jgi:hypothetical protein
LAAIEASTLSGVFVNVNKLHIMTFFKEDDDDPDGGAGKTKSDEPCISKSADDDDDDDGTTCPICFDPWTSSGEHRVMFPDWRNFWALYDFKGSYTPHQKNKQ